MATFRVTDPNTGKTVRLTGDSAPTEQELEQIFANIGESSAVPTVIEPTPSQEQQLDVFQRAGEFASENIPGFDVAAEFAAGANEGIVDIIDFLGPNAINGILELAGSNTRVPTLGGSSLGQRVTASQMDEGLAQEVVNAAGKLVPSAVSFGQAIRTLSKEFPKLAAMTSAPAAEATAAASAGAFGELGEEIGGDTGKITGQILGSFAPSAALLTAKQSARGLLAQSSPEIKQLKGAARDLYKQIDNLGVTVKPEAVERLSSGLSSEMRKQGFNQRIHPKVSAALDEVSKAASEGPQKLEDIDILRRVAQSAARSMEPDEARLGSIMIEKIDDFLDAAGPATLTGGKSSDAGVLYKQARGLWGRARKAEILEGAFEKAKNQASGFENGLRVQFRSILNNKKLSRGFNEQELEAMRKVVRGGTAENIAKAIGRFGFTEGQATNMLLSSLGVAGGAAVGGAPGAVAVPVIGQVSRNLAQRLTRKNAEFASQIVRSGKDGKKIVDAYIRNTPKEQRDVGELTQLLINQKADVSKIEKSPVKLASDAAFFASFINSQEDKE